ncbi:PhzF family phenazine biosynthesis protein [Actinoplanes sp. TFC3]|uniref:PhzF family phenazine biosynthesis protein n=1 Tax=Actinoplanes sp. TFC3 TaxID=1710355 RepID=UPI000832CF0A|nr:PhzF family phenazine biosynthesis protein [Actinoplanes sp. TFC3]
MSTLVYEIVDVFTDRPFAGNPLAVVFGAEALGADQMQAVAREFNLSETVFVLPPTDIEATYRARIFTPASELPFAGHPSVGAAVTAVRRGLAAAGKLIQECGAGLLPVVVSDNGSAVLTGGTPEVGAELDPVVLLEITGLAKDDQASRKATPSWAGCGLFFAYLPVERRALVRAWANVARASEAGVEMVDVFAWDADTNTAYSRVFCPVESVPEDPATGSAALGLGVWLVANGWLPGDGTSEYTVHQGIEMHRPSLLTCTVTASGGAATSATVAGHVVPVARGEIMVPPFIG